MTTLSDKYVWLFDEIADPRVKDWFFVRGPGTLFCVLITYLYLIKVALPAHMKGRPAYNLKTVIRWYNITQVLANIVVFYKLLTSGWTTTLTFGCELPDYTLAPEAVSMVTWMWWTMMLKLAELLETMFFVLRKKESQASFLHMYHHVSTLIIVWMGVKYVGGGMASFTPLINTFIHIIMYIYYLASSEASPELRAKLNKWKMWLTVMQMVQFTFVLIHSSQAMLPACKAPRIIVYIFIPNIVLVYFLFYDFFKKAYSHPTPVGKGK